MDLTNLRAKYTTRGLDIKNLDQNPFKQFETWFNEAIEAKLTEPNAFSLATVGKDMMPSIRTVLLKIFDEKGFVFFTNYKSTKANQIEENPKAAALFPWLDLERQVKIEGDIQKISTTESLKYFLSRPKGSQIGAWVSHQSQVISSRSLLEQKFDEIKNKFVNGEVPFPSFWGGYIIKPTKIEFWQGGQDRLHDRFLYELKENGDWSISRLAP
ncbi:pyridoxamine 5'-phosphate oxidase [Aliarcobacter butzleri]|uniref:pyridoxamine 5'-phosphate oxidase n=1 Tax=Aliarcobacter butzleri TaxID=28197 RepID=UPI0012F8B1E5|nr:pyridoxamine 5'-phosphate oxidase [Aliarcobacter butzleri]MCT7557691.1 pyridoxamine 5'-phosphate oxidase [Aliarcobacter butzleri]MCT7564516.1 pyridoxamine 5'-phosphate oxidase [Aliarcobacter butzleri]MCT7572713.1 pyridoxamine 5'-phosphate oxidase [Aliarcobacter butzleri]MCT7612696.1 pyridoxamine 5'-phosphate oxidase [Aliarcobacter butzleri]MCT7622083.1 pyridoxamine 5'-phosphate oxidase [Aliarcobacter butzleri]